MLKKIVNNSAAVRDIDLDPSASEYNVGVAASNGMCAGSVRVLPGQIPDPGPGPMVKHSIFKKMPLDLKCGRIW